MFRKINNKLLVQIISIVILILLSAGCSAGNDKELSSTSEPFQETNENTSSENTMPNASDEDTMPNVSDEDTMPNVSETNVTAACDYLGLSLNNISQLIGKEYKVANYRSSTGFYFEDIPVFFFIGEYFPEGHQLNGNEIAKSIDVGSGQILPGVNIGDTAANIANKLNIDNFKVEYSEEAISEGDPPYVLFYETEINGFRSSVYFYFNSPEGGCEYAFIKADEL